VSAVEVDPTIACAGPVDLLGRVRGPRALWGPQPIGSHRRQAMAHDPIHPLGHQPPPVLVTFWFPHRRPLLKVWR
jgi:hypothetical protein